MQGSNTDVVGMARFMRVLTESMIEHTGRKIVNVHHATLPDFEGAEVHRRMYRRGTKIAGATSHYATREVDKGPIISQSISPISHLHSPTEIAIRNREAEQHVFAEAIKKHVQNKVFVCRDGLRTVVFD